MYKRGEDGRSIMIFCQFFLSLSTEKPRRGTSLFFTNILVPKTLWIKSGE